MLFRKFSVAVGFWVAGSLAIMAATAPFIPQRGIVFPETWADAAIGGIFQNPAQLVSGYSPSLVRIDTAQDFLGYSQYSVSLMGHIDEVALGAGYYVFGAQDLVHSQRNSLTGRIEEGSGFGDVFQQFSAVAAREFDTGLEVGINLDVISRTIDTTSATQFALGVGARIPLYSGLWMTGAWRRLLQKNLTWGQTSESTVGLPVVGVEYRPAGISLGIQSSGTRTQCFGDVSVSPDLSIVGDYVMGESSRYSVGTIIRMGGLSVQYSHVGYLDSVLATTQELIGMTVNLDDVIK